MKGFFAPAYQDVSAVSEIDLRVERGERVAFIGPNGAGKSTTIKMMSGILHPSSGDLSVLGWNPQKDRRKLGYAIGTVFGQKSQLWYHLPARDTFELFASIYEIERSTFKQRLNHLSELFQIEGFMGQTVRKLSLGQRMRCELVASLLHQPKILFLDEPTIGLDVTAKAVIRDLIKARADVDGTTWFLTSHDTGDIESVCQRVVIINEGKILMDSSLSDLRETYIQKKQITFVSDSKELQLSLPGVRITNRKPHETQCEVDLKKTPVAQVIADALKVSVLKDITVTDPPMEEIIHEIYQQQAGMLS